MDMDEQTEAVALLSDPASHCGAAVEMMETHISYVFLAGDRAYKMKRSVRLPDADFSTPELRLAACRKELDLNSRTAPELYLRVRRITRRADGTLEIDGRGKLVDAVVEMKRFDQSALFDRMAQAGRLTPALMTETARAILRSHRSAPVVHSESGAMNIAGVLDINRAGFAASRLFAKAKVETLDNSFRTALAKHAPLLDKREIAGKVRRCHGDLHLRNIFLLDGKPRLFDCIEFNDAIATIDVLYDLAFLLMDLWHRGFPKLASIVANRYLDETDDEEGFALLPFFMAIRAAVRAHVTATHSEESGEESEKLANEAKAYFEFASKLLAEHPAWLVAIGGLSGSGKTTVAEAVAAHVGAPPGARIVESDRIRKAMHGVAAETRLPEEAYRPDVSERVYNEMAERTGLILSAGGSVVADAVFDRETDRARIEKTAKDRVLPFLGIWLDVAPGVLRRRIRERKGGPSDATVDILLQQLQRNPGMIAWQRMNAARRPEKTVDAILALLRRKRSRGGPIRARARQVRGRARRDAGTGRSRIRGTS